MFFQNLQNSKFLAVPVILLTLLFTGCPDADKRVDEAFKKKGLNRIRTVRQSIDTGAVILVKDNKANYADNIADYFGENGAYSFQIVDDKGVISSFDADTKSDSNIALKFIDTFLPVKTEGKIGMNGKVELAQIGSSVRRIKIPRLIQFLGSQQSTEFKKQMGDFMKQGYKVYIAYEAYRANKIKFKSEAGSDIAVGATIGTVKVIDNALPKFTWTKKTNTELDIDGTDYYTFALRTARLDNNNGAWIFELSNFAPTGTLGAGDPQSKYSNSPLGENPTDFKVLDIDFDKSLRVKP